MLPEPFYNRTQELSQLDRAWQTPSAQLVTLWGRRRVGKSTLLATFAQGKRAVYIYGTRAAERDVLAGVATQAAASLDDPYLRVAPFPTWDAALTYFERQAQTERLLVILDEFSYLCDVTPGLDTLLQRWWDHVHRSANIMVTVASSAFSFMRELAGYRGALHGRRTGQLSVEPFDYVDAASFFPSWIPVNRIRGYSCFGGSPAYLSHIDPEVSLADNLTRSILAPGHVLFREAEELLRTEFHQEALYSSILRAIATGEERPSDIARAVGRHSANEIFDHLQRLIELRFVTREVPVTEQERPRSQRVLYRLGDPYLRFWYRYVSPFQALLQLGQGEDLWRREMAPSFDEFVTRTTWEEVCRQHLWRRVAVGSLPTGVAQLGRWWDSHDEIDLVGMWQGKVTLVGECKWTGHPIDEGVLTALQIKAHKLPLADSPCWVLASRTGFTPSLRRRADHGDVVLIDPADMFSERNIRPPT